MDRVASKRTIMDSVALAHWSYVINLASRQIRQTVLFAIRERGRPGFESNTVVDTLRTSHVIRQVFVQEIWNLKRNQILSQKKTSVQLVLKLGGKMTSVVKQAVVEREKLKMCYWGCLFVVVNDNGLVIPYKGLQLILVKVSVFRILFLKA